jgi:hypothetical protein
VSFEGRAGEPLSIRRVLGQAENAVGVALTLTPRCTAAGLEGCGFRVRTRVETAEGRTTTRDVELAAPHGRLRLAELWHGEEGEALLLTLVARWGETPRVSRLLPGARDVELVVEVLRDGRVSTRHRLGGIVGRPSRLVLERRREGAEEEEGTLSLIATPRTLRDDELDLSLRLELAEAGTTTYEAEAREWIPHGGAVEAPLPQPGDQSADVGATWSIRVRGLFDAS